MEKQKNKRMLISAASENDPYNNKNNRDGSINSIIRRYTIENKRIDEIYIVLTLQTALRELYGNVFSKSIKHIDNKIEIHFYPEGIFAEINNNIKLHCSDILQDESLNQEQKINRYVERLIDKDLKLAMVDVNKFGWLYEDIYSIIEDIRKKDRNCELLFNVSSGTPQMEADLLMMAITNKSEDIKIIQASAPFQKQNRPLELPAVDDDTLNIIKVIEEENIYSKTNVGQLQFRASEEKMRNTKLLILLASIKDSFEKRDFAGVYNSIIFYKSLIENKDIIRYAQNLYYRYIGNPPKANEGLSKNEKSIYSEGNISQNELYPIYDIKKKPIEQYMYTLERLNIMKVKAERGEINDWLLIAESTLEAIYKKIIFSICQFDVDSILDDRDKISFDQVTPIKTIKQIPATKIIVPNYLIDTIFEQNGRNISAVGLIKILETIWSNDNTYSELEPSIRILDKLRDFRNMVAHTQEFVTIESLNNGVKKQIQRSNYWRSTQGMQLLQFYYNNDINIVKETEYRINEILERILPKEYTAKDNSGKSLFDREKDLYKHIERKIIKLLNQEIKREEN